MGGIIAFLASIIHLALVILGGRLLYCGAAITILRGGENDHSSDCTRK